MPVLSPPGSGIATAVDWKLAMTPENIRLLEEDAREVYSQLCECVDNLGRLKEAVVVGC